MNLLIAGIHTGTGKTVCSAVFAEALGYDYWKPVQAGSLDDSDSMFVQRNTSQTRIHPEAFRLKLAASPHIAAAEENLEIKLDDLVLPHSENFIITETAGGIMSPLSNSLLNIGLAKKLDQPVVLVSDNYLGSINHTLLTVEALKASGLHLAGLVFCGKAVTSTRDFILQYSKLPLLASIPHFEPLEKNALTDFAAGIKHKLKQHINELAGTR